jgi:DNA-binding SARP family transcriptional activator
VATGRDDAPRESWSLFRTPAFCGAAGPEESTAPIQLLGPLRLVGPDGDVPLGSLTQRSILAHLLVRTNQVVATSQLVESVWRGHPPTSARKIVQNTVSRLRRLLADAHHPDQPEVLLLTRSPGYQLITPSSTLDVCRFQELTVEGREALAAGEPDRAASTWRRAVSLWRGPAMADLTGAGLAWPELDALHNWRLDLLEDLFDVELSGGRHELVLTELQATAQANPGRERLRGLLALALRRCGRTAEAEPPRSDAAVPARTRPEPEPVPEPPAEGGPVERRELTVLLVRAGAGWGPDGDPVDQEDADEALSEVDAVLRRETGHAGGLVAARVGSLWLAVFGLRPGFGDHAHRAVLAAFAIRHGCAELDRGEDTDQEVFAGVRIAVATGEVLVRGAAGAPVVCGAALERGHGMVNAAPPTVVRLDAATRAALGGRLDCEAAGDGTWTALGVPANPAAAAEPGPPIGRDAELRLLTDLVSAAQRPHVVTVVGEPGSGKSRLVGELARVLAAQRTTDAPLPVRAPTVLDRTAPVLLARGVRACCAITEWDAPELAQTKLRRVVARTARDEPERAWLMARLGTLLAAPEPVLGWETVFDDLLAAWWRLVERVAAVRRIVVLVDDLDQAFRALGRWVTGLTGGEGLERTAPLLVVATTRVPPAVRWPDWRRDTGRSTQVRLGPLDEPASARLITGLLAENGVSPSAPLAAATVAELATLSRGVPLRAREYCALLRDGLGTAPDRAYSGLLSVDGAVRALPRSVRLDALARLEELPAAARAVARTAAAVGDLLWAGAVAEGHGGPVEAELGALVDAGVLVKDGAGLVAEETQLAFADAATRHVAYAMAPRAQRIRAHTRVARWLDRLPGPCASAVLTHYRDRLLRLSAATGHSFDEILLRAAERLTPIVSGDVLGTVPDLARYHLVLATTATRYPLALNSLIRHWHAWQLTHRQVMRRPAVSPATGEPIPPGTPWHLARTVR